MEYVDKPTLIDVQQSNDAIVEQVKELYRLSDIALFALYQHILDEGKETQ